jgi:hypothetical protein
MSMPESLTVAADVRRRNAVAKRNPTANERKSKRHRAAALQDLAERAARNPARQRLGVRQPYAAFVAARTRCSVLWPHAAFFWSFGSPQVGGYSPA